MYNFDRCLKTHRRSSGKRGVHLYLQKLIFQLNTSRVLSRLIMVAVQKDWNARLPPVDILGCWTVFASTLPKWSRHYWNKMEQIPQHLRNWTISMERYLPQIIKGLWSLGNWETWRPSKWVVTEWNSSWPALIPRLCIVRCSKCGTLRPS